MKFNPLNKTLLVELEKTEEVTPGGIHLPESARDSKQGKGRVVAATDKSLMNTLVVFPAYSGTDYEVDGKKMRILKEEDLLGYLDDEYNGC